MLAPIAEATPAEEPLLELGLRERPPVPGVRRASWRRRRRSTGRATPLRDAAGGARRRRGARRWSASSSCAGATDCRCGGCAPARRAGSSRGWRRRCGSRSRSPDDHAIDPRALTAALPRRPRRAGGELRERRAGRGADKRRRRPGQRGGPARRPAIAAADVVIAAGGWSARSTASRAGARVPVRPVKGQILRLHDPAGPGLLTRVMRMGPSYIVPRGDGRYVIGATQEERGFDTHRHRRRRVRAVARRRRAGARASRSW